MRRPLLWLLLAGLAIALLFLILHHEEGSVGSLSNGDFSSLAYGVALLVFLGGTALTLFRERFAQALTAVLLWAAVALLLVVGYSYRFELHEVADRVMAELVPGHVISHGRSVEVARAVSGDFDVSAQINGARVAMVLDTGASSVVLTRDDAKAAGLPLEVLAYTVPIRHGQRPRAGGVGAPRPHRRRRAGRALGRSAGGAAGPAQDEPPRHELPQPAAELGGTRRPAIPARLSVMRRLIPGRREAASPE